MTTIKPERLPRKVAVPKPATIDAKALPARRDILISRGRTISIEGNKIVDNSPPSTPEKLGDPVVIAKQRSRAFYTIEVLRKQYENLIILSGAGTSYDQGKGDVKGKTMAGLWDEIADKSKDDFAALIMLCEYSATDKDLESLLSRAYRIREFKIKDQEAIDKGIQLVEKFIRDSCTLEIEDINSPHQILLNRITKRKLKYPRPKIFTLNYDTLFEQAASKERCIVIDGFSFTYPREFNGRNFDYDLVVREHSRIRDEENFVPKAIHLYKLHGSIDWEGEPNGERVFQKEKPSKPLMIYPTNTKFEHTYERPFFEMTSRFQTELRKTDVLLICSGFSLADKHIFNIIKESLALNHGLQLLVVNRTIRDDANWRWLKKKSEQDSRIVLAADEFKDFVLEFPDGLAMSHEERLSKIYDGTNEE